MRPVRPASQLRNERHAAGYQPVNAGRGLQLILFILKWHSDGIVFIVKQYQRGDDVVKRVYPQGSMDTAG